MNVVRHPFTASLGLCLLLFAAFIGTAQAGQPKISVTKTASPTSLPAPGGTFTFTVVVTNTDNQPITAVIDSLVDDVYGNLSTKGTCTNAVGTELAPPPGPGSSYTCSFTGNFTGSSGDKQTDTVTATVHDKAAPGDTASSFGKATVSLTDPTGPTCSGAAVTIPGTAGPDTLVGTPGADVIAGFGGNDVISGAAGNDVICGGAGQDVARGNGGNDKVKAGGADDKLRGGSGNDELNGGSGNDRMRGGSGKDTCRGGRGRDRAGSCETVRSVP